MRMHIWILKPRDIDDESWQSSSHRGTVLVRAPNEHAARKEAQKAFGIKTRFLPGKAAVGPPWLRPELVDAEITTNVRYETDGPVGVLEPSFETDLRAAE